MVRFAFSILTYIPVQHFLHISLLCFVSNLALICSMFVHMYVAVLSADNFATITVCFVDITLFLCAALLQFSLFLCE